MRATLRSIGVALLALLGAAVLALTSTVSAAVQLSAMTALILGGTGNPQPDSGYVAAIDNLYLTPKYSTYVATGLTTPEQFWPETGLSDLTFGQSVNQGVSILDAAITSHTSSPTDKVVVVGYSQSAAIATIEARRLAADPTAPGPGQLSFVLLGDPNNPNGGILQRFNGFYIPILNVPFDGATPDGPYPTTVYTIQYDGWADFPEYPLNVIADANALLGILYLHPQYPTLTPAQLATAVEEPTTGGSTTYELIPTANLPLLQPLVDLGNATGTSAFIKPIVDLIQPVLRVIVELGYDRLAPANVPTSAQLVNLNVNPFAVAAALGAAVGEGINAALGDLSVPTPLTKPAPSSTALAATKKAAAVPKTDATAKAKAALATLAATRKATAQSKATADDGSPTTASPTPKATDATTSNTSALSVALRTRRHLQSPVASKPSHPKGVEPSHIGRRSHAS